MSLISVKVMRCSGKPECSCHSVFFLFYFGGTLVNIIEIRPEATDEMIRESIGKFLLQMGLQSDVLRKSLVETALSETNGYLRGEKDLPEFEYTEGITMLSIPAALAFEEPLPEETPSRTLN